METVELDTLRARWRRRRDSERLVDPSEPDFGRGRLGSRLPEMAARVLILPPDPERYLVEFDEKTREWWQAESEDPVSRRDAQWGGSKDSTAEALLLVDRTGDVWSRYLGLGRDGSVEAGLGDVAAATDRFRGYMLTNLVHRLGLAVGRFALVQDRYGLKGPFELVLGLTGTKDAVLADFGEGWAEPGDLHYRPSVNLEDGVLLRRELGSWEEDPAWQRALAYSIGGQVEDSW